MPTLVSGLVVATGGVLIYWVAQKWSRARHSDLSRLPKAESPAHWILGHEKEAWETSDGQFYVNNFEKYGQVFVIEGGLLHPDILALSDPGALTHMYSKAPYTYTKSMVIRPLIDRLMGRTLAWAEGEEHKKQRAALAPVFTHEAVKRNDSAVRHASDKLVEVIREHIQKCRAEKAEDGGVAFDPINFTSSATLDIIGEAGLGFDFGFGSTPEAKAIKASWVKLSSLGMTTAGFVAPLVIRAFPLITDLPVKEIQAQGEIKMVIRDVGKRIVKERRMLEDGGELRGKDLLSTLLRMEDENLQDLNLLLDHISSFIIAGFETTATSLNMALYNLAHHKSMQDLLRKELRNFASSSGTGEPTYDEFQSKLPVLDAVIKETLRVHPAISHTERVALEDDVLPLRFPVKNPKTGELISSVPIKKGQTIFISHIAVNRVKAAWGPDANEFKPERWLASAPADEFDISQLDLKGVSPLPPPSALILGWNGLDTFLEGPRICIGMRLAVFEMKVMLTQLIKQFEFLPVEGPAGKVGTMFSSTLQAYVPGKREEGNAVPLRVREVRN